MKKARPPKKTIDKIKKELDDRYKPYHRRAINGNRKTQKCCVHLLLCEFS